jgi:hypothetical protein
MTLNCGDLDRALRMPELMREMRAHAEHCTACSAQLHLWSEMSRLAPALHEEWDSPFLWPRIQANLAAEAPRPGPASWRRAAWPWAAWRWVLAAACTIVLAVSMLQPWRTAQAPSRELLTERALAEVRQSEQAYARSIEKLSAIAGGELQHSSSPVAAAYREKLTVLDAAIADVKAHVESNSYNPNLQAALASLYQDKQRTLQEWLHNANRN